MTDDPQIEKREIAFATRYFRIVAKTLRGTGGDPYYSILTDDYVCVLAVTDTGAIPLVRQYRPAVEAATLELPSGHVDPGETPEEAASRELLEETGFAGKLSLLGCLRPDTGRIGNRMWCFFAASASGDASARVVEEGVELVMCAPAERRRLLRPPMFDHALHLAALQLALIQGRIALEGLAD